MSQLHISTSSSTIAPEAWLKIGQVAQASHLPVKTIRYYEDIGLLAPTVRRSPTGYRLFHPQAISRLAFIKQTQNLGLSLSEIQDILTVRDRGELPCNEVHQHLQGKLAAIDAQIVALQTLKAELQSILTDWHDYSSADLSDATICPNLQPPSVNKSSVGKY